MKVLIGTRNTMEVVAISRAFKEFFSEECEFLTIAAKNRLDSYPFNEDVYKGAMDKIIYSVFKTVCGRFDYYISCEEGIIEQFGHMISVKVVCIFDGQYYHYGISNGYDVPHRFIRKISETSLEEVMEEVFGNQGGLSYLSNGVYSSEKLVYDATIMALASSTWRNQSKALL